MQSLSVAAAEALVVRALTASGASEGNARATARALVAAEVDGQAGHGLSRVASYAAQLRAGKIDGQAVPSLVRRRPATLCIDAHAGLAYPALDLAVQALPDIARDTGLAAAGLRASHHIGQAGYTAERLADAGCVALVCSNTPRAMAFHGGVRAMLGTNPLAFAAPLTGRAPLVIDMALTQVARSRVVAAQRAGRPIPGDWAMDAAGQPTTDPSAALAGSLAPVGGAKGAALALMVEILCGALAGGHYGWEASSFLDAQGGPPGVGQLLLAFDTAAFGDTFTARMDELLAVMRAEPGVRLPGDRRLGGRAAAAAQGLLLEPALLAQLTAIAQGEASA